MTLAVNKLQTTDEFPLGIHPGQKGEGLLPSLSDRERQLVNRLAATLDNLPGLLASAGESGASVDQKIAHVGEQSVKFIDQA